MTELVVAAQALSLPHPPAPEADQSAAAREDVRSSENAATGVEKRIVVQVFEDG